MHCSLGDRARLCLKNKNKKEERRDTRKDVPAEKRPHKDRVTRQPAVYKPRKDASHL